MNRMNRRRCDALAPLFAAAWAGAALAGPATSYELVIIEPWNTSYSLATSGVADINNLNQVTGCATPVSGCTGG